VNNIFSFLKENIDRKEVKTLWEDVEVGDGKKEKRLYITGPFLQGNVLNKNGRIYPTEMLAEAITKFMAKKKGVGIPGELNHPMGVEINLDRISHYITELKLDGNNGIGKALLASTDKGRHAAALINDGMVLGVSTRGLGKLTENKKGEKVVSDFDLVTVDLVADPSAPDAYVESLVESLQYYIKENGEAVLANNVDDLLASVKRGFDKMPKKSEDRRATYFEGLNRLLDAINKIK
jgi:hypothetical protein